MEGNTATASHEVENSEEEWDFQATYAVDSSQESCNNGGEEQEEMALVAVSDQFINYDNDWIVDSGCSNHMTGDERN